MPSLKVRMVLDCFSFNVYAKSLILFNLLICAMLPYHAAHLVVCIYIWITNDIVPIAYHQ